MAWKVESVQDLKKQFVLLYQTGRFTMTDLCRQFNISRPTGYALLNRFDEEGWDSLEERSRRHTAHPWQTADHIENAILEERNRHPRWGARKLRVLLARRMPDEQLPSETTVNNILKKHGLATPRKKPRRQITPQFPVFDPELPNEIWSADFKGKFRMGSGVYCNPLTIADSKSRYLFEIKGLEYSRAEDCKPVFEKVFREYGLPQMLHTDNGPPFGSPLSLRRMTTLAVWLMDLDILPVYSDPGKPQQNGRHERMHRDLKAEATRPPGSSWRSQQRKFDTFRHDYNFVRPHEALGMLTPSEIHVRSLKEFPRRIENWDYPKTMRQKLVTVNGALRWNKDGLIMISTALTGRYVGLECMDDGVWLVHYRNFPLGVLSERTKRVYELEDYEL